MAVEVLIENVCLVISPKGKEAWEVIETFQTNPEMKEELIMKYAMQMY